MVSPFFKGGTGTVLALRINWRISAGGPRHRTGWGPPDDTQYAYDALKTLSRITFLPETTCHQYLGMAGGKIKALHIDGKAKLESCMYYALRAILCCEWIVQHLSPPPMQISDLLSGLDMEDALHQRIDQLIELKKEQPAHHLIDPFVVIMRFLHEKMASLPAQIPKISPNRISMCLTTCSASSSYRRSHRFPFFEDGFGDTNLILPRLTKFTHNVTAG